MIDKNISIKFMKKINVDKMWDWNKIEQEKERIECNWIEIIKKTE
jgi:hypothetical protein